MTPHTTGRRRAGFTLIEMTAVMAGLVVVLAAGVAVLVAITQAERAGSATGQRVTWRGTLADQFRGDVAAADAAPDRLGDLVAGPACLVLHRPRPKGEPDAAEFVVYRWHEGHLTRTEWKPVGAAFAQPLPSGSATVEFTRPAGDRPLLTLRLTETPRSGPARRSEVSAALGGDLR